MFNFLNQPPGGCRHDQQRLQRRNQPSTDVKFGLPGMGTIFGVKSAPSGYRYYCPACKTDLPASQNARWESLYNSFRPATPAQSKPRPTTTTSAKNRPSPSKSGRSTVRNDTPVPAKLRYDILTRDGYRCVKCGATGSDAKLHVDHKVPRKQGGSNDPSNLQTLCESCNLGKGARRG